MLEDTNGTLAKSRNEFRMREEAIGDAADAADNSEKSELRAAAAIVETAKAAGMTTPLSAT